MKNKMTARKKQSLATKNRIFLCATELFAKKSYEKITISDICRAAHVSTGAFYHHFASKEEILNEGYRDFDELVQKAWQQREPNGLFADIRFLIQFQLKCISANGYLYATQLFKNQLSNQKKYILDQTRFFYQKLYELVANGIQAGDLAGDASVITETILRFSRGTIYDWCLHEGAYALIPAGMRDLEMVFTYYRPSSLKHSLPTEPICPPREK